MSPTRRLTIAFVIAVMISACSSEGEPAEIDPRPISVESPAAPADITGHRAPQVLQAAPLVEAGWSTRPQVLGDIAVGHSEQDDGTLEFSAIDGAGTVLWTARRPLACTGFALTVTDGRPIAVLTNSVPGEDTVSVTTATAYDLRSGHELWGPVPVPGPHVGPGLVYAQVPAASMGQMGPRHALDPASGQVAASETDTSESIVGEYDGIVLTSDATELRATIAGDSDPLWQLDTADLNITAGTVEAAPDTDVVTGFALLGNHVAGYSLIDVADGTILASQVSDAARADADTVVAVTDHHLARLDANGEPLWTRGVDDALDIQGVVGGFVFARSGRSVHAFRLADGQPSPQYPGDADGYAATPVRSLSSGAAVLSAGEQLVIAIQDQ